MALPSSVTDRLRGIIAGPRSALVPPVRPSTTNPGAPGLEAALGGTWWDGPHGRCFVVERRFPSESVYGRASVGAYGNALIEAADEAALMSSANGARAPFVFFDLETTGLSGGAGTYAFLVGCGAFDERNDFVIRQFVLERPGDERPMLRTVADLLAPAGALVSFNGKSFDAPLLETRHQFHRLPWLAADVPHVDVLHSARRFWRESGAGALADSGCSLTALERQILGTRRHDDVPGFEVPARYFNFIRTGDARPLEAVLEHNWRDLLSLAGLTATLARLVQRGPAAATHAREALALGHTYARAGFEERARESFARAAAVHGQPLPGHSAVRVDALRALAITLRRARRFDDAAACWRRLLESGCPSHVAREASEALAIHHEHRVHDLETARMFALQSLENEAGGAWHEAVHHRLRRLEKKMGSAAGSAALDLG